MNMPSTPKQKPEARMTPRQLLCYNRLGTGQEINLSEYREFLFTHGTKVAIRTRQLIKELTGYSPLELRQLAPDTYLSNSSRAKGIRSRIKNQLLSQLPFLKKYHDTDKESGLRELARTADDYIRAITSDFFPGEDDVQLSNEVSTSHDAEALMIMAFHDGLDSKAKFEASRKLLLMKFFGEIVNHNKKHVDHDKALSFMTDFFNRRINKAPEGAKIGHSVDRYLLSTHEGEELMTTDYEILDEKPEGPLAPNVRVTPMRCRRTVVQDEQGNEREIFFRKHPRDKDVFSRLTKTLRYDSMVGEKDADKNGIRLSFDNRQDWDDFFRMFRTELANEMEQEVRDLLETETDPERREALESRLLNIESSIDIKDEKDSLNGAEFNGSSTSSSSKLKIHKFKLKVVRGDGRIHEYEFQVFLPDGYADYLYRKGVSWEEYNADRFFRENVDELLFPKKIYPAIDRNKLRARVMKMARQKVWNGNGNGLSKPKLEELSPFANRLLYEAHMFVEGELRQMLEADPELDPEKAREMLIEKLFLQIRKGNKDQSSPPPKPEETPDEDVENNDQEELIIPTF